MKLKKVHRVTQSYTKVHKFNQKTWLQSYTDTNIKLKTNAKTKFEKDFFNLMNNSAFGKTIENVRNHRDMKLVTSDKRRKRLVDIYIYREREQTFVTRILIALLFTLKPEFF